MSNIVAHLSYAQQRAFGKFIMYGWYSAYDLQESLTTLKALVRKGFLDEKHDLGSAFFPRNAILFRKISSMEVIK